MPAKCSKTRNGLLRQSWAGLKYQTRSSSSKKLLDRVDNLLIGGGMTYTFIKAMGGNIGNSLLEADKVDLARQLIEQARAKGVNLVLPADSIIADAFKNDASQKEADNHNIPDGWMGLDIGPKSRADFSKIIEDSRTILWNGPMGVFELPNLPAAPYGLLRRW